ncbi:MAG: glycine--tRNA ligase [archaeon]
MADDLLSFIQQKGFIWGPEPELYGGLSGFYTYGPLGKLLKNRVEGHIRRFYQKNDFWEVECPTIMPRVVWEASGHLTNFTDPVVKCTKCLAAFRSDNLIKENFPDITDADLADWHAHPALLEKHNILCPKCKGHFGDDITRHTLMMRTTVGLDVEAYNRPETATTTYLPFIRYFDYFRKKLPFAVFQIGKAYRNEISPRQHVLRMREFTQAEAQIILFKDQKDSFEKYPDVAAKQLPLWTEEQQLEHKDHHAISCDAALQKKLVGSKAYLWALAKTYEFFLSLGIPEENIRLRQHGKDEKAFYAIDAWDVEIKLNSFGWTELCGVHDRGDYDLGQHEKNSKRNLKVSDETHKQELPHIIEIAFGTDRPVFALLDLFYEKNEKEEAKSRFKIPIQVAPVQLAVFPLVNKENLPDLAKDLYNSLMQYFICKYDSAGSIGRRYLREDEAGTAFCITVDFDTSKDGTVTVRERDTEKQIRVPMTQIKERLEKFFAGEPFG